MEEEDQTSPVNKIAVLKNTVQNYAWGSFSAIPQLLGEPAHPGRPQAELWMGAHPKAPSLVDSGGTWEPLSKRIAQDPISVLGEKTAARFKNQLPFLFKVLAAAKPLSIQAHPHKAQAVEGFDRENRLGIPLNASNRNYRDKNHKPEIICALSSFWALSGFRPATEFLPLTEELSFTPLTKELAQLKAHPGAQGLRAFFSALLSLEYSAKAQVMAETIAWAKSRENDAVAHWIVSLHDEYPSDIGVLAPLFLNVLCLKPGEALFLPSGHLHAYLEGVAIELMANSDNVLRGGLTSKHVDVAELLRILSFEAKPPVILEPEQRPGGEGVYASSAEEFVLCCIMPGKGVKFTSPEERSVEILLCVEGSVAITGHSDGAVHYLEKGASIIIPAAVGRYTVEGEGTVYKATVPG